MLVIVALTLCVDVCSVLKKIYAKRKEANCAESGLVGQVNLLLWVCFQNLLPFWLMAIVNGNHNKSLV